MDKGRSTSQFPLNFPHFVEEEVEGQPHLSLVSRLDRGILSRLKGKESGKVKRKGISLNWPEDIPSKKTKNQYPVDDKEEMLQAVAENGLALEHASPRLRNDRDVVRTAIRSWAPALQFASAQLRNDMSVVLIAIQAYYFQHQNGNPFEYASEELQNNKEFIRSAVMLNGSAFQYVKPKFKSDREIVLAAVGRDARMLHFAPQQLQDDREFILEAVQQGDFVLENVREYYKNDREIVLTAVRKNNGIALKFASTQLKNDREFIMKAIKANKTASLLQFASKRLQRDGEMIAFEANQKSGSSCILS